MTLEPDGRIADVVERQQSRLLRFIRARVRDPGDAEDVLQDAFTALVEANRLLMPVEHVTGFLFRVARNRIADLFRRKREAPLGEGAPAEYEDARLGLEDLLPSPDSGPDALYARSVLLDALEAALRELPAPQREAFVWHEIEGLSFKEMSAASGVSVNTLLSRKHYAVRRLRERLRRVFDELEE